MQESEEKAWERNFKIKNFCFPKVIVKQNTQTGTKFAKHVFVKNFCSQTKRTFITQYLQNNPT